MLGPYVNQIFLLVRGSRGEGRTVQKSNSPSGQRQPARVGRYRNQILLISEAGESLGPCMNQIFFLVKGGRGEGRTAQKSDSPSGQ